MRIFLANFRSCKFPRAQHVAVILLLVNVCLAVNNICYADEEEKRRIDISLSIFPRIVAVDNNFRSKLDANNHVQLEFVYREGKKLAESLAGRMSLKNKNIGGMEINARAVSVNDLLASNGGNVSTAIFLSERLIGADLEKVLAYAEKHKRIVFSPFVGDVERGVTVGISVTNRVKPYFNLKMLSRSSIDINALLMKMSKRYE